MMNVIPDSSNTTTNLRYAFNNICRKLNNDFSDVTEKEIYTIMEEAVDFLPYYDDIKNSVRRALSNVLSKYRFSDIIEYMRDIGFFSESAHGLLFDSPNGILSDDILLIMPQSLEALKVHWMYKIIEEIKNRIYVYQKFNFRCQDRDSGISDLVYHLRSESKLRTFLLPWEAWDISADEIITIAYLYCMKRLPAPNIVTIETSEQMDEHSKKVIETLLGVTEIKNTQTIGEDHEPKKFINYFYLIKDKGSLETEFNRWVKTDHPNFEVCYLSIVLGMRDYIREKIRELYQIIPVKNSRYRYVDLQQIPDMTTDVIMKSLGTEGFNMVSNNLHDNLAMYTGTFGYNEAVNYINRGVSAAIIKYTKRSKDMIDIPHRIMLGNMSEKTSDIKKYYEELYRKIDVSTSYVEKALSKPFEEEIGNEFPKDILELFGCKIHVMVSSDIQSIYPEIFFKYYLEYQYKNHPDLTGDGPIKAAIAVGDYHDNFFTLYYLIPDVDHPDEYDIYDRIMNDESLSILRKHITHQEYRKSDYILDKNVRSIEFLFGLPMIF